MSHSEIDLFKNELIPSQTGEQLILHVGDCAESFADCKSSILQSKLNAYEKFREALSLSSGKQVLLIGRIAGQYAKPRSEPFESYQGVRIPTYKGDMINSIDPNNRQSNPNRMIEGYHHSTTTMNYIRHYTSTKNHKMYISHEALLLAYEDALTRTYENKQYDTSAHFLWLGERTRKLGLAHVEFLSHISNPIGVKIGPNANLDDLQTILSLLNPDKEAGKLILIPRLGVNNVTNELPRIIQTVKRAELPHV